jgi:hypothetical protein
MSDGPTLPVQLLEDEDSGDRFLVYGTEDGLRLEVQYSGEALWMTQAQIAQLFGRDRTVITKHLSAVFDEGELDLDSNVQKMHFAHSSKPVSLYSLDAVISVGYRVSSKQATKFRRWATQTLVQFATKGFVVDSVRLKNPENADRVRELREIIKDIRSDEANVYRELQRICAMCEDYEGGSQQAMSFFMKMQAKLVYAVVSNTPAEVVKGRANAADPNMGLQTWPNDNVRKADVTVSKNYLAAGELKELNSLTTILLDVFELQLDAGRLVRMKDAESLLDRQLSGLDRVVLNHGGSVTKKLADTVAHQQYAIWKEKQKELRHREADRAIKEIAKEAKKLAP